MAGQSNGSASLEHDVLIDLLAFGVVQRLTDSCTNYITHYSQTRRQPTKNFQISRHSALQRFTDSYTDYITWLLKLCQMSKKRNFINRQWWAKVTFNYTYHIFLLINKYGYLALSSTNNDQEDWTWIAYYDLYRLWPEHQISSLCQISSSHYI